jgi:hypothetical protein
MADGVGRCVEPKHRPDHLERQRSVPRAKPVLQRVGAAPRVVPPEDQFIDSVISGLGHRVDGTSSPGLARTIAHRGPSKIRRTVTTMPVAYVGNDPATASQRLKEYFKAKVTDQNRTLGQECSRVEQVLTTMQPSKVKEMKSKQSDVGITKDGTDTEKAARLEVFVQYLNQLIADFHLDTAASTVKGRVDDDGSHHMDYFYKLPTDDAEKKFDLDEWSRKPKNDFMKGKTSGPVIQGIVNEAVKDWDTEKGGIAPILVSRLLGAGEVSGSASDISVSALFMNSPMAADYIKILTAARHTIDIRVKDLTLRGVGVEHWKKTDKDTKDRANDRTVNWPALLKTARAAFKVKMGTDDVAVQDTARSIAVTAIFDDPALVHLRGLGVLDMDKDGTFSLNNKVQRDKQDCYQALKDERFNFDINHFTAILFFEWKLVTDLKK